MQTKSLLDQVPSLSLSLSLSKNLLRFFLLFRPSSGMLAEGPPSLSLYLLLHLKTQGHDWIITNCGRESEKKKEESGLVDGWMDG